MEVSGQLHDPNALPTRDLLYPLDRRLGGLQSRCGRGADEEIIRSLPMQGIETRRPAPARATHTHKLTHASGHKVIRKLDIG